MKVNIYRVGFFTITDLAGKEVRREVQPTKLVAAKDNMEATKLLPLPNTQNAGEANRNVVITCQLLHANVIAAERLSLDEELAKVEAT